MGKINMANKNSIAGNFCPKIKCRWKDYGSYKLILWVWMMNEVALAFSPTEISHSGFYVHGTIHALAIIFVGLPLVYSEICLGQYTNCNIISMWDFFPLFSNVGYGLFFLILLKTIYLMILTTWYLEYSFYAALDPPPWFNCEDYNTTKCMVKRTNISVFQHCLEAQILFDDDCGMKTASNCFFSREIGDNSTMISLHCVHPLKAIITSLTIGFLLFVLTLKKEKFIQVFNKLLLGYVCTSMFILFCVATSTSGTWYATRITVHWYNYNFISCFNSCIRGFLSVGTGYGIIMYLSRDVPFRSPATTTSVSVPLFSLFITVMYSLIGFGGVKTMSYYHGEEENVIEIGSNSFFSMFASMSEILIYFDAMPIWAFMWFSSIFICLFANLWIIFLYLRELMLEIELPRKYKNLSCLLLSLFICILSCPFFCSDLTSMLTDATEVIQITNSLLFSIALYWMYGCNNHNIDIIFMIGIKASYFWKIAWVFNPVFLVMMLYFKWEYLAVIEHNDSYYIKTLSIHLDLFLFYFIIGIYVFILVAGVLAQLITYYRRDEIRNILLPTEIWGPRDKILFKSRKMFVPEIMTREFLYRQVRIHGYCKKRTPKQVKIKRQRESSTEDAEWSAFTSN